MDFMFSFKATNSKNVIIWSIRKQSCGYLEQRFILL